MQCLSRNINLRKESQTMTNQEVFACKAIPEENVAHITIVLCLKKNRKECFIYIFAKTYHLCNTLFSNIYRICNRLKVVCSYLSKI